MAFPYPFGTYTFPLQSSLPLRAQLIPNLQPYFKQCAEAIWNAGEQGTQTIFQLTRDASFINHHWTLNKEGPYTEYYFPTPEGKMGPFVRVHEDHSEIFFGHYHRNLKDGSFIKIKLGKQASFSEGSHHYDVIHGECRTFFRNEGVRTYQYDHGILHGLSTYVLGNRTESVNYVHGNREGRGQIVDNNRREIHIHIYKQNTVICEMLQAIQIPDMELAKESGKDWVLRCYFKNCPRDLPLEWYMENMARRYGEYLLKPFRLAPPAPHNTVAVPSNFLRVSSGFDTWKSIDQGIKDFACSILAEGYQEERGEAFKKTHKKVTLSSSENNSKVVLSIQDKKLTTLVIDVLNNGIFFSTSQGNFLYYGFSYPHLEELPSQPNLPIRHRLNLPHGVSYYTVFQGQKQGEEYLVKPNGDLIGINGDVSTTINPKWPGVEVLSKRIPGGEEVYLVWYPPVRPVENSVPAYLQALFNSSAPLAPPVPPPAKAAEVKASSPAFVEAAKQLQPSLAPVPPPAAAGIAAAPAAKPLMPPPALNPLAALAAIQRPPILSSSNPGGKKSVPSPPVAPPAAAAATLIPAPPPPSALPSAVKEDFVCPATPDVAASLLALASAATENRGEKRAYSVANSRELEIRNLSDEKKVIRVLNIPLTTTMAKAFSDYLIDARAPLERLDEEEGSAYSVVPNKTTFRESFEQIGSINPAISSLVFTFLFESEEEKQSQLARTGALERKPFELYELSPGKYLCKNKYKGNSFIIKKDHSVAWGEWINGKWGHWTYLRVDGKIRTQELGEKKRDWRARAEEELAVKLVQLPETDQNTLGLPADSRYTGTVVFQHPQFPRFSISQSFKEGFPVSPPIVRYKISKYDDDAGDNLVKKCLRALPLPS